MSDAILGRILHGVASEECKETYSCMVYKGNERKREKGGVVHRSETEGGMDVRSQDSIHPEVSQAFLNRY